MYNLGTIAEALGNIKGAINYYIKAAKLGDKKAQEVLEVLKRKNLNNKDLQEYMSTINKGSH